MGPRRSLASARAMSGGNGGGNKVGTNRVPRWPRVSSCVRREPAALQAIRGGNRLRGCVGPPPTEPKVTGSNPVGRAPKALHSRAFLLVVNSMCVELCPSFVPSASQLAPTFRAMRTLEPPTGHVFRRDGARRSTWYAKYRLPNGRQVQKRIGPASTERGRPRRATTPSAPRAIAAEIGGGDRPPS